MTTRFLARLGAACIAFLALVSPGAAQRGGGTPGDFDFYVLALSWSAGFCEIDGDQKGRRQCEPGAKLGFVVHGLWPQYQRGYPSDCDGAARSPSRIALDGAKDVFPEEGLARHQWRKHGSCSGKSPTDYFTDVRRARAAIEIPKPFLSPDEPQTWSPLDIERAFAAVNPRLRTDNMAVSCRRGVLEEVLICFSKDLRGFVSCPEVNRRTCRTRDVSVPPVR